MIRDVLRMGDPRLWQKSLPVSQFNTKELDELLRDMRDTMAHLNGAGLAAPQIAVPLRVVIFGVTANPRYPGIDAGARHGPDQPGADSALRGDGGGLGRMSLRPRHARLGASLSQAAIRRLRSKREISFKRDVEGFHARVVQHEVDHLDGVLYPMRIRDLTKFGFNEELFPGANLPPED